MALDHGPGRCGPGSATWKATVSANPAHVVVGGHVQVPAENPVTRTAVVTTIAPRAQMIARAAIARPIRATSRSRLRVSVRVRGIGRSSRAAGEQHHGDSH